ncbi:MAG: hypothetical protein CM15mP77_0100 [Synechococcus sp.]|nr:MAG: hypothetical protein CM15mP77_0100 [Synechococcus sp.]
MRVLAQVEQLHLLDADLHHKEVIWDGSVLREFWGRTLWTQRVVLAAASPKGSSTGERIASGRLHPWAPSVRCPPQPVLLPGFAQQPAEFHLGLMAQLEVLLLRPSVYSSS